MYTRIISIFMLLLFLSACGTSNNETGNNLLDLDGTWVSNCYLDDPGEYTVDTFIFSGNNFETSYKIWNNSSCIGTHIDSDSGSGTFTVGNEVTTASGLTAIEVDFEINFNGQTFTVLDIIRQNGNEFYYGTYIGLNTRPTDLNFNVLLTR